MHSGAAKFAHALGIDEVVAGNAAREPRERDRTVTLTRVSNRGETEATATKIVKLLFPSVVQPEAAKLLWFVLVELLRNVVQHSLDPAGGIVAAQCNDGGPYESDPTIQIVVADNGIGIFEALRQARSTIQSPEAALLRALEPHVSGTFVEGGSGTVENAGLGLFFVREMAKRTKGRLLLASRGASYYLDRYGDENTQPKTTGIGQPKHDAGEGTAHKVANAQGIQCINDCRENAAMTAKAHAERSGSSRRLAPSSPCPVFARSGAGTLPH